MKLFTIIYAFLICLNSYANYSTPGTGKNWNLDSLVANSGGDVTFSGGNYFFNDTLVLSQSDTLKILMNTTVKLSPVVVFSVFGTLIINPADSVKFNSLDTNQKFYEMRLDSTSDASLLRKLIFEYSFNGLRLLDTSPLIDSCTFRYNCSGNSSTTVPAINLFRASPVISNCRIYHNYKVAIGGGANIANAPQILYNIIYENDIANGNVPQINLGASGSGTTLIKGNTIKGFYTNSGGIATLPIGQLNIRIEDNIIKFNRYGIAITNATTNAIIKRNIIDSNNIQGLPNLGGSGINFNGVSSVTAVLAYNKIRGNLWGITIQGTAKPNLGDLNNPDTNYAGYNIIMNNINSNRYFDLFNNTPDSIKAENNFWGINNLDSVEARIFHKPDSTALGFVDYIPLWNVIAISSQNSEIPDSYKLFDAYPNPFNPETNINFQIPVREFVSLKIFDLLGKEIFVLVSEELNPGLYNVKFNSENLSSGVYFYRLQSGNFTETKKLVFLK
jgi:hypothetical protein